MQAIEVQRNVAKVAAQFAVERKTRQLRRELVKNDFEQLHQAGFLLTGIPVKQGGLWESPASSTRAICEILRELAHGDSSVALVAAMHPSVLIFWLTTNEVPAPYKNAWEEQQRQAFETASEGAWWGTITSEPGSGGDIARSKAHAEPDTVAGSYRLTGQKHFGSGSGITSFMLTVAVPAGEARPDLFYLDMREVPWDGSTGLKLVAPWDGHGMIATQSHAMQFENFPARRWAWPGRMQDIINATCGVPAACFSAVIVGIVETAMASARELLASSQTQLGSFEQVEWVRARQEAWLVRQAYEGILRAFETQVNPIYEVLLAKTTIAELAESLTGRLCKLAGGGSFSRKSPFGFWFEDVRALGFLRPPWHLAYEGLYKLSWANPAE